jgi:hypothetical protein
MRTIPMKARKSNSSKPKWADTGLGPSLHKMHQTATKERRIYMFSIALFAVTITGLAAGSIGGVAREAAARDTPWHAGWNRSERSSESNRSNNNLTNLITNRNNDDDEDERTPTTTPIIQPTQQTQPTQVTPPAPTPAPQQQAAPAVAPAVPRIIPTSATVEATPIPDTAPEIATMTSAQAVPESAPITYTTHQISEETRNQLLALAIGAAVSGALIFMLSTFTGGTVVQSPVRYRVPVREVTAS